MIDQVDRLLDNVASNWVRIVDRHIVYPMGTVDNICVHRFPIPSCHQYLSRHTVHQYIALHRRTVDHIHPDRIVSVVVNKHRFSSHIVRNQMYMDYLSKRMHCCLSFAIIDQYHSHLQIGGGGYHSDGIIQKARLAPVISYA